MKFLDLKSKVSTNIFTFLDVEKHFAGEDPQLIKTQLSRFAKKGFLIKLKRGLYCYDVRSLDELMIANILYTPSYISLESALNYYGIIPDIPQSVTSITLTTSKKMVTHFGNFYYAKIKRAFFFGFTQVKSPRPKEYLVIAEPEKALLDYIYIRKIKTAKDLRLEVSDLNRIKYNEYKRHFPDWVQYMQL